MKDNNVIRGGWGNGKRLREILIKKNRLNQIDGIVYPMLNDLKIFNREAFLDKYMRLMMNHELGMSIGIDELTDIDRFMQFGYAFITGLLSSYEKNN